MNASAFTTIIAQSTPQTASAIHIIRISGPEALDFLSRHTFLKKIRPRHVYHTLFFQDEKTIDDVVCFYLKAPKSYTGEDMVELHCHGSSLISKQILSIGLCDGLHPADPGDFTRRAFLNGKLSIEQAEAVDVLIRSKHEYLKDNALKILERRASLKFQNIRESLLTIMAHFEATIEFPEEKADETGDVKKEAYQLYQHQLEDLIGYFLKLSKNFHRGKKLDTGLKVAIIGRPNVGKSSLMNALLREERVLVSEIQGTTRDYVREQIVLGETPIYLYDTAGIRNAEDMTERAGIDKTRFVLKEADILILLAENSQGIHDWVEVLQKYPQKPFLPLLTKRDLKTKEQCEQEIQTAHQINALNAMPISSLYFSDIEELEIRLSQIVKKKFSFKSDELALLNDRQYLLTERILESLKEISIKLAGFESEEILVEDIKILTGLLDELNLSVDHDEVFDKLFSSFCIGK